MRRVTRYGILWALVAQAAFAASDVAAYSTTQANTLPMDGEGTSTERIVKVADLHITSDAQQGFELLVTSGNLGKADGETPVAFQVVTVAEGAAAPTAAAFTTPAGSTYVFRTSGPGSSIRQLYIRYTSAPLQDPGTYSASVGVSLVEN